MGVLDRPTFPCLPDEMHGHVQTIRRESRISVVPAAPPRGDAASTTALLDSMPVNKRCSRPIYVWSMPVRRLSSPAIGTGEAYKKSESARRRTRLQIDGCVDRSADQASDPRQQVVAAEDHAHDERDDRHDLDPKYRATGRPCLSTGRRPCRRRWPLCSTDSRLKPDAADFDVLLRIVPRTAGVAGVNREHDGRNRQADQEAGDEQGAQRKPVMTGNSTAKSAGMRISFSAPFEAIQMQVS